MTMKLNMTSVYLAIAMIIMGYFAYSMLNGVAFWESSTVTRNTEYNGTRSRGPHTFYHK